jgi:hypothetical protein
MVFFYETMAAPKKDAPHVGGASAEPLTLVETANAQDASSQSLIAINGGGAVAASRERKAGRAGFVAGGLDTATATANASVGGPLPTERSTARDLTTLGPSPGQQSIREVFAEDVIARRVAYGKPVKILPEGEDQGN